MTISERIRIVRQQKNISQTKLAKITGINIKSLSRYELGASNPPANAIKSIADALEISTDYLLSDKDVKIKDKNLFKKFELIQNMNGKTKEIVTTFLDLIIRDYKAKKAYSV